MTKPNSNFENYFAHLKEIRLSGRIYKRFFSSPTLYLSARRFGKRIAEVGSGTGSGVLGAFPNRVAGLEINPLAVKHCHAAGLNVQLIREDGTFPVSDGAFDVCILDNVLEHIDDPRQTLDECYRVSTEAGGLVIAVPGFCGFRSDDDHKKFYGTKELQNLDKRWTLLQLYSMPFLFMSDFFSERVRQYCLVATYQKK